MDGVDAYESRRHADSRVTVQRAESAFMLRRRRMIVVGLTGRIARLQMADGESCGTARGQRRRQAARAEPGSGKLQVKAKDREPHHDMAAQRDSGNRPSSCKPYVMDII